jgi:hypothetical protein
MYEELEARLKKENVNLTTQNYEILEKIYIAMDFDKDIFAKIVDSISIEELIKKEKYFEFVIDAVFEKQQHDKYVKNLELIEAYQREISSMKEFNERYKKSL